MAVDISDDALTLAARLYYSDGVPQQEVAAILNVSQAKVSRLLALARERGIVTITVNKYEARNREQEELLSQRFGLKEAMVIRVQPNQSPEQTRKLIGHFAAPLIAEKIQRGMTVGLAGGRTIHELIESYQPHTETSNITVVQLMGNVAPRISPIDASEIGRTLATKGKGSFLAINAPVFATDPAVRDSFLNHDQLRTVSNAFTQLNMALVGIGTPENSILADQQIVPAKAAADLKKCGVCGEICGRFFDGNGNEAATVYKDRTISIGLKTLRNTPLVFGVANGKDRAAAIVAAIKGKIINSIIIDSECAGQLLKISEVNKGRHPSRSGRVQSCE